ncbi:S8 family peptidase [Saxibacter everestensis]|uniref:S8 family peptidase n=1 Tax=Saxibacter everestensis TaxID=2909229 RepID=A0ABY8QUS2_9MICO|nr:S8 family peptidase [Brevibacteriaceae bacterium ZFBP1038]
MSSLTSPGLFSRRIRIIAAIGPAILLAMAVAVGPAQASAVGPAQASAVGPAQAASAPDTARAEMAGIARAETDPTGPGHAPPPAAPKYANGLIVKTTTTTPSPALLRKSEALTDSTIESATPVSEKTTVLRFDDELPAAAAEKIAEQLAERADVVWAEPDYRREIAAQPPIGSNDPFYGKQYNVWDDRDSVVSVNSGKVKLPVGGYSVHAPELWNKTKGSSSVVVAVIDTGITNHPDLDHQVLPGYDLVSDPEVARDDPEVARDVPATEEAGSRDDDAEDPGDWWPGGTFKGEDCERSDSSWHGTHVAGIVAAQADNGEGITGVAPGVSLLPVRALGVCGGYDSDITAGIVWAAGGSVPDVPQNTHPAQVINLSLGGYSTEGCPRSYQDAIDKARSLGSTVVVAAGNESVNVRNSAPANCSGVITVGSTDEIGERAWYSNYGTGIDVSAPGGDNNYNGIWSAVNTGTTVPQQAGYGQMEGTSMAAPAVAGAAALLYSLAPGAGPDAVESALKSSISAFPKHKEADWTCTTSSCGTGILNLGRLITSGAGSSSQQVATVTVRQTVSQSATVTEKAAVKVTRSAKARYTGTAKYSYTARYRYSGHTAKATASATRTHTIEGKKHSASAREQKSATTTKSASRTVTVTRSAIAATKQAAKQAARDAATTQARSAATTEAKSAAVSIARTNARDSAASASRKAGEKHAVRDATAASARSISKKAKSEATAKARSKLTNKVKATVRSQATAAAKKKAQAAA